jgi:hypothetical protein
MARCPSCGHENLLNLPICEQCYAFLSDEPPVGSTTTVSVDQGLAAQVARAQHYNKHYGLLDGNKVALYLDQFEESAIVPLEHELILGRYTPGSAGEERFDLTPYGGADLGISRLHAVIRQCATRQMGQMEIVDLGSTNGTWLNEARLAPYVPSVLRSGDHIRLARMWLTVYFQGDIE